MIWSAFISQLKAGNIIPVVGTDLSLIKDTNDKPAPLQFYLAQELTSRLNISYTGQRITELVKEYSKEDFEGNIIEQIIDIYDMIPQERFYTAPLDKLAEITGFKFYISTAVDDCLEKALRKTRQLKETDLELINYSPQLFADSPLNLNQQSQTTEKSQVTLFNLLGSMIHLPQFAITDEAVLEHFISITSEQHRQPLAINFLRSIKNKIFLFLGCDFPHWFMFFIIRIITNQPYAMRKVRDYIIGEDKNKTPYLKQILSQFTNNIIFKEDAIAFIDELHQKWCNSRPNPSIYYSGTVFLSYNNLDLEKVKLLKNLLNVAGIQDVWLDIDNLHAGDHRDNIKETITKCKVFIPLISNNALTHNQSYLWTVEWANIEDRVKADKYYNRTTFQLIPIILDDTARNDERIPQFMRDVAMWNIDKNNDRILDEIKRVLILEK